MKKRRETKERRGELVRGGENGTKEEKENRKREEERIVGERRGRG